MLKRVVLQCYQFQSVNSHFSLDNIVIFLHIIIILNHSYQLSHSIRNNFFKIEFTFSVQENQEIQNPKEPQLEIQKLTNNSSETKSKKLYLLHSTLSTLQHQQVHQLQLIEQLQSQLMRSKWRKNKCGSTFDANKSIQREEELRQSSELPAGKEVR